MLERLEAADESMTIMSIFTDGSAGIVERLTHYVPMSSRSVKK
jgi:hypothetical protein